MSDLEDQRKQAVKKYIEILESEKFMDEDKGAIKEAEIARQAIEKLDFEIMTPLQQFRKRVEDAVGEED